MRKQCLHSANARSTNVFVRSARRRATLRWCACAAVAGTCVARLAGAADISWVGAPATPLSFGFGGNWAGGLVPDAPDAALINNGGVASVAIGFSRTVTNLSLGTAASTSGTYVQSGGTMNATGNATFGDGINGAGTLVMSGGALNVGSGFVGDLNIGRNGAGTANISGGTINTANMFVGRIPGGSGTVVQTGGAINVTNNLVMFERAPDFVVDVAPPDFWTMSAGSITVGNEMYIGAHGPATFNLSGTGFISVVGTVHIAASGGSSDPPAGVGTLNMSSGTINVTGANAFFVVADHGDGTFNFSGGSITTKFYNIGQNFEPGFSSRGVVNQTGGSATAQSSWVIGEESRSANLYDLSGGTVTVVGAGTPQVPGDLNVASGPGSKGTLTLRGTGVAGVAHSANVGNATFSSGTVVVSSSGSLALGTNGNGDSQLVVGVNGTGNLQIQGGNVSTDFITLGQNSAGVGTGTQTGGTLVVRGNISVGESSAQNNVYDISGGTMSVGGGIFVGSTGNGILSIGGTAVVTSALAIENAPTGTGTISVSGGRLTGLSMNNRRLYTQSGGSVTLGAVTGPGQTSVSGGSLAVASVAQGTLQLSATGRITVTPNGTDTGVSVVNNLSITNSGKLDLNDNTLIVDYTGASPVGAVRAALGTGYNGGAWTGNGLASSAAATAASSAHKTALGYAEASALFTSFPATFKGQSVDNTSVLVRYTYAGDSNIDGKVDLTDFTFLAANFNKVGGASWLQGDYNYDGNVDLTDFTFLASNFNQTLPAGAAGAASIGAPVPEPGGIAALSFAVATLARRRRFKRQTQCV
jgi:hypothetical protein